MSASRSSSAAAPSLMDLEDLAGYLRLSSTAAARKLAVRDPGLALCVRRIGRRIRFDASQVRAWVDSLNMAAR